MTETDDKRFKKTAVLAARAADDKKGEDIVLLHIRPISSIADYLLLVSVNSPAHLSAVEDSIRLKLKADGLYPTHRDGRNSELWRVLDYGGLLIHLMHPQAREFYALEKLFHEAKKVAWAVPPQRPRPAEGGPPGPPPKERRVHA